MWYSRVPMALAVAPPDLEASALIGEARRSPAGPLAAPEPVALPPARTLPRLLQTIRFGMRPMEFSLGARAELGDVWRVQMLSRVEHFVVTSHPDHVESLLRAKPDDAPSLTGESPLRPVLGPNSVLTSVGERHMRQRKLLLPPFHGDAVERYVQMISDVAEREIDGWRAGEELKLAPRMQAVTLKVIMAGIFGIEGTPAPGTLEHRFYSTIRRLTAISRHPLWHLVELRNLGRLEARGALKRMLAIIDRDLYALIRDRRERGHVEGAND